jgi:hypothetical protein
MLMALNIDHVEYMTKRLIEEVYKVEYYNSTVVDQWIIKLP